MTKRKQLKSKELNKELEQYNISFSKKDLVELIEDKYKIIFVNKKPTFFYYQDRIIPVLKYIIDHTDVLKKITVDMGAIKFVVNGADIMRPGITKINIDIKENEPILIVDEQHNKPLAIGIALQSGQDMQASTSGKSIKNLHYVGDEIWQMG